MPLTKLPYSLPPPAVQGFSAVFVQKRRGRRLFVPFVSVRPRVGHGVGQSFVFQFRLFNTPLIGEVRL